MAQHIGVKLFTPNRADEELSGDEGAALRLLLPDEDNENYPYLRYIDPYDNTIFTNLQMTPLLQDIDRLIKQHAESPDLFVLERLRAMALRCSQEIGRYLHFYGD